MDLRVPYVGDMEPTATPQLLARFADHIAADGIALVPAELVAALVSAARAVGASDVLIGVVADPTEPPVARERAFGKLAGRLIGAAPATSPASSPCTRLPRVDHHARGQTPGATRRDVPAVA